MNTQTPPDSGHRPASPVQHHLSRLVRMVAGVALVALSLLVVPRPAAACACGAVISNSTAAITGETALVVWDGATETIDMVLSLAGQAEDAGWIMPTPPGTAVSLGDASVFPKLVTATAPRVEKRYTFLPTSGDELASARRPEPIGAGAVSVQVTHVGPFTVSTLSSSDAEAVNTWLAEHLYPTKPALTPTFEQYLAQGWSIQAVKLTGTGGGLAGDLDPLRMTFPAATPVYPIMLSQHALQNQTVTLYLVGAHRLEVSTSASTKSSATPLFAGRVPAADLGLAALDGDSVYLTAFTERLVPASITADYTFRQAADDTGYQRVVYEDVDLSWVLGPAAIGVVGVAVVGAVVGAIWVAARRARGPLAR